MAELEVDQSNLPRVQEVSQYFAVLEDGALAHNLQEQEIEQFYSSNVQRNQLVQKDIRVAKRLQDEEQQRARMLREQATRQLEDQDLEYACRIQEEIQHTAEEEKRREEKDEEIAKQIQEEEVLYVRQRNSCRRTDAKENGSTISSSSALQPSRPLTSEEAWHYCAHTPSTSTSDCESDHCECRRSFNRDYTDNVEQRRQPRHELPLRRRSGQSRSSFDSQNGATAGHLLGGWGDVVRLIKNDMSEQGFLSYSSKDELFEPIHKLESMLSRRQQASERRSRQGTRLSHHSSMREENSRMWQGDQAGRYMNSDYNDYSESVRSESRQIRHYSNGYCTSGDSQRRVRFQDDQRRHKFHTDGCRAFVENNGGRRELRSCTVKPYRANVQVNKTASFSEVNRMYGHKWGNGMMNSWSQEIRENDDCELRERERWEESRRAYSLRNEWRHEKGERRRYRGEPSRRRVKSERWQGNQEDRSSTEEEEEVDRERGEERRRVETRAPRHPQLSLGAFRRGRSPGAGQTVNRPSLDLGELRQVLQDEELARRLQAEEEELIRGDLASASPLESSHPKGDFTVAQVAQDEEIARFMQKQELMRSQELEDGSSEYREVSHVCDGTEAYDGQRERLNSEGLLSPVAECSPEHHPPSPVTLEGQQQSFRNIAEALDPTFQRKDNAQAEQSIFGTCQIQTSSPAGSCEEPAFVAPTKRQNDKVVRAKSKEKKENSKSKENCKQQ